MQWTGDLHRAWDNWWGPWRRKRSWTAREPCILVRALSSNLKVTLPPEPISKSGKCYVQRWTKRWALGCEKILSGPAGLLLSNTRSTFKYLSVWIESMIKIKVIVSSDKYCSIALAGFRHKCCRPLAGTRRSLGTSSSYVLLARTPVGDWRLRYKSAGKNSSAELAATTSLRSSRWTFLAITLHASCESFRENGNSMTTFHDKV